MIKHEAGKWVLYTKDGEKKLGTHDTEAEARAQERAVEAAKHRAAGAAGFRALLASAALQPRVLKYEGEHPFAHCMEVVVPAMAEQGKEPEDPEAFCAWWKMEHASAQAPVGEMRELHLLGATGAVRTEVVDGREHLVVPVVALMEGVIHAVNASKPEFVSLDVLKRAAASWDGKPITLGHPTRAGKHCSADSPDIRSAVGIGTIRKPRVEGTRLLCEALVDKARAKALHPEMYARLADGKHEEVSVGALVLTDKKAGEHKGKPFLASWLEAAGDHLAFLPGGRGACSGEMGCGAHRAAACGDAAVHLVTAEGFRTLEEVARELHVCEALTTLDGQSLDERIQAVNVAVQKRWGNEGLAQPMYGAYAQHVFDDRVIIRKGDEMFSVPYTVSGTEVVFGEPTKVKQTWVAAAAKYKDCPTCDGTGQVTVDGKQRDCEACDGEGQLRAAAGARHSSSDVRLIQAVHDHATALGATCERPLKELAAGGATAGRDDSPTRFYIDTIRREAARVRA